MEFSKTFNGGTAAGPVRNHRRKTYTLSSVVATGTSGGVEEGGGCATGERTFVTGPGGSGTNSSSRLNGTMVIGSYNGQHGGGHSVLNSASAGYKGTGGGGGSDGQEQTEKSIYKQFFRDNEKLRLLCLPVPQKTFSMEVINKKLSLVLKEKGNWMGQMCGGNTTVELFEQSTVGSEHRLKVEQLRAKLAELSEDNRRIKTTISMHNADAKENLKKVKEETRKIELLTEQEYATCESARADVGKLKDYCDARANACVEDRVYCGFFTALLQKFLKVDDNLICADNRLQCECLKKKLKLPTDNESHPDQQDS